MGNSSSRDKNLIIYIETDKTFYNSGSNIDGVVFVEAITNFTFDALYIRVEGIMQIIKVINGVNGMKGAQKIVLNILVAKIFMLSSIYLKNMKKIIYKLVDMLTHFRLNYLKIYRDLFSHLLMRLKSNIN